MARSSHAGTVLSAMVAMLAASGVARADGAVKAIGIPSGESQLFVNDFLIDTQAGLKRTLRQPKKDDGGNVPVLALDKEFGDFAATLEANGSIVYDPRLKRWVMFALGFSSQMQSPSGDRVQLFRFTSPDAMNWVKGDDGSPQRITFDLADAASGTSATNIDLFSCYFDDQDPAHPYKGWLHFANWPGEREGTYYVYSSDGKTWQRGPMVNRSNGKTIQQDGRTLNGPGDVTVFSRDEANNRFLGSLRFASPTEVVPGNRLRARVYTFVDRLDRPVDLSAVNRAALVPAAAEANGDMPADEYYGSTAWRCGSHWLGGLRVWHGADDYPHSAAGSAFLKFVASRDGLDWKKVQFPNDGDDGTPEVWLPNGKEGGNAGRNDGGYMTEFSQGPLRVGDELILYYGASSWGKTHPRDRRVSGGGVFRARLRVDGYVSVDGGTLTTKPLEFEGDDLIVNAVGPVDVELLDAGGAALARATVSGDSIRHAVTFDGGGKSLRRVAGGGAARLRFTVREKGRLYSFTTAPAAAPRPNQGRAPAAPPASLRVAAVQMRSTRDLSENAARIRRHLEHCKADGVRVAVFPECALTGYFDDDYHKNLDADRLAAAEQQVRAACRELELYAVVGTTTRDGERLFNSAIVIDPQGRVIERYHKIQLAEDWPQPGDHLSVFRVDGVPCSIIICHDERYPELVRLPVLAGARVVFYISHESPIREEHKLGPYRAQIQARAMENNVYVVHANAPANEDLTGSHGQSRIVAPDGRVLHEASMFDEEVIPATLDLKKATGAWARNSLERGPLREWWAEGVKRVRVVE